jgi:hypothetical protein
MRVPDAVQRLFDGAPQSRDRHKGSARYDPGSAAHHAARAARCAASGERNHPRPTNGILLAITVMNSTLASSGSVAM